MRIEDVIHIDAPTGIVWDVTVDIERWPEWTPTVTAATPLSDGPFQLGSRYRLEQPGLSEATWVVTELVPGERFTWESQGRGMEFSAMHELDTDGHGTVSTLQLEVSGLVARLLWPLLRRTMQRALAEENQGLKERCEALAAVRSPAAEPSTAGDGRQPTTT